MAKLVVRNKDLPAEVIELKPGIHRFGRSSGNEVQIDHPTISRFHCEVEVTDSAMFVRDTDSSNGTYVDEYLVEQSVQLAKGHVLRIGDVRLEVKEVPVPAPEVDKIPCVNHPQQPASLKCTQCHKAFCGSCVHILKRTNGQYLRLCPVCSGHCEPLEGMSRAGKDSLGSLVKKLFKKNRGEGKPFYDPGGETRKL